MDRERLNPYQAPSTMSVPKGHARFRLRGWFALTLYLVLFLDLLSMWTFGVHPFLVSIPTFMLFLAASAFTRHRARISVSDSGITYQDLVQFVDVSWYRVVKVVHKSGGTSILTDSLLAQITVSRRHEDYEAIVNKIADLQAELDFSVLEPVR